MSYLTYNSKCLNYRVSFTSIVVYAILPLVTFDYESLNPKLTQREVPGTAYELCTVGWMDVEIFKGLSMGHF